MRLLSTLLLVAIPMVFGTPVRAQEVDWQKVDDAFGRKAAVVAGDVHRYDFPRTDLSVTRDGIALKPAFALIGWITMKPMHGEVMAMGDLVLLDGEINPVMTKMIENGFEVTALHHHLLSTTPDLFFMHVSGHGDPVKIASTVLAALAASKTPLTPPAAAPSPAIDLDTTQLDQIIGVKGRADGGVYGFVVPRRDPITDGGMPLSPPGPFAAASELAFQPTGGGKAAITGDLVMTADEVNPVIKALRANGIEIAALHSHMLVEQPRLFFMHFWANDDAVKLAKGLRAALDKMANAMR
jgi:hypothetical protein